MIRIKMGKPGAEEAAGGGTKNMAVVVDALRSSATVAAFLTAGAGEVLLCPNPEVARAVAYRIPDSILAGEWNSRTPEGFRLGNSPIEAHETCLDGETIVFTSSNGAPILVACRGAGRILMGGPTNASQIVSAAQSHLAGGGDVVIIPAGDRGNECEEDMAAAVLLAEVIGPDVDPGQESLVAEWRTYIADAGLESLFRRSHHGRELIDLGYEKDLTATASPDIYPVLPEVESFPELAGNAVARLTAVGQTG